MFNLPMSYLMLEDIRRMPLSSMRVGHYLRVEWLSTELGENSVFLGSGLKQVKRKI